MSVPPSITIDNVQVAKIEKNSMTLSIKISGESIDQINIETKALLDTGAGGNIDQNFVQNQKIKTKNLEHSIEVFNVDGTPNKQGTITKYTWLDLTINGCTQPHNLFVTGLGKQKIILGYPWFKQNNPEIDWEKCTLNWRKEQDNLEPPPKPLVEEETNQEDWKNHTINPIEELDNEEIGNAVLISYIEEMRTKVWINVKGNMAMELAIKENEKKAKLTNEELVPEDLHEFLDVFDKNCQGFISRTPARVRDGSLPKGLNKYLAQLSHLRQLRTRIGSKYLVMYDCKQLSRLTMAPDYLGNPREEMSQVATQTFNILYYFPFIWFNGSYYPRSYI